MLLIQSMTCGGAQRVMSVMANHWAKKGWDITLVVFDGEKIPYYRLHPAVDYLTLDVSKVSGNFLNAVANNFHRVCALRRVIKEKKPEVMIAFMDAVNIIAVLSAWKLDIPVVISQRNNPWMQHMNAAWKTMRSLVYPLSSALVVQTEDVRQYFKFKRPVKTVVIPNPVPDLKACAVKERQENEEGRIIAMGRLVRQKGFDILISAFSLMSERTRDWKLVIWGEGELRDSLLEQVSSLKLEGRVLLPGNTEEPYKELGKADIFVLPSRYEGYPNVLCEAMACGLPVISSKCPSGPSEIIRDGVDGILVPPENAAALAESMEKLITDKKLRESLSGHAGSIAFKNSEASVMKMWEELLFSLLAKEKKSN